MIGASVSTAGCTTIELEIEIAASRETVWQAIFDETQMWWLPEFRVSGPDAKITFDATPGGRGMFEEASDGSWLLWFNVQMYLPKQFKVYLFGHIAPEWGGPTTSSLRLALEERDAGCVLQITDARHGHIDENQMQSYSDGWTQLFGDGLRTYVESK